MKGHVLITGGTGFIGSHLIRVVSAAGYSVSSVSRCLVHAENFSVLDLTNSSQVDAFAARSQPFDAVIHCAAIAHGEKPPKNSTVSDFNSSIVENLINAFGDAQPHWIFLSSVSVYGESYLGRRVPIDFFPLATEDYGKGKLRDEYTLSKICEHLDIIRLTPAYDLENMEDIKKRVFIPKTGIKLRILPSPTYSFCEIKVVCDTVLSCLHGSPNRRLHQIGDKLSISQHDLVKRFPGTSVIVPQLFFSLALLFLPSRISWLQNTRLMVKKLGLTNTFELDVRPLGKIK